MILRRDEPHARVVIPDHKQVRAGTLRRTGLQKQLTHSLTRSCLAAIERSHGFLNASDLQLVQVEVLIYRLSGEERSAPPRALVQFLEPLLDGRIMRTLTVVEDIRLSAPLTPIQHSAGDDRQNGPTGGGYYHLADDGAVVEAPQSWD